MRTLLILLLLCSFAQAETVAVGQPTGTATSTDSCVGGLLFSWHCENTNVTQGGIAGGVNNGCSAGDTTATANSSSAINGDVTAQDGIYSCDFPGGADYYGFTVSTDDIINDAAGTVIFYVYITTYVDETELFRAEYDANNSIVIKMNVSSGNKILLSYKGNSTTQFVQTSAGISTGAWKKITAKWSVAGVGGDYLYIAIDDASAGTGTTAITAFTSTTDTLRIGNTQSAAGDFAIDNVKIWDSWL